MSWNTGVFAAPPGASGVPQQQPGQQVYGPPAQGGYGLDHLPPPPGAASQQWGQPQQPAPYPGSYVPQPGVPGAQVAQPLQTQQQPQQWGQPQQQGGWGQPGPAPVQGYAPQQQGYAPNPQQQTAQGARRAELDDNVILDGPAVPPELRGRTWADARRLYSALSNDWLQRNRAPQTPAQQSLQAQGLAPQSAQGAAPQWGQQPQQAAQGTQSPAFWQNPDQRIAEVVSQTIEQRLGPVIQQSQSQGILQARNIAATGIRDFDYLEPEIMQIVAGSDPATLQNPQVWIAAARMARGQRMEQGQYNPQAVQARQQQPPRAVPAYDPPPVHSFFSESPSAPSIAGGYGQASGARQPTQDDYHYAQKWQMPIGDFMAWKYGMGAPSGVGGSF